MEIDFSFEVFAGIVFPVFLLGIIGNVLTIVSLLYAKIKGNHNFNDVKEWRSKTVFILNLAVVDLLYCLFIVAMCIFALLLYLRLYQDDNNDQTSVICKIFVIGLQEISVIEGWSIALIAITRAFPKIR